MRHAADITRIEFEFIGEHAGSGVPDIFDVWESEGLEIPMVEEQFGAGVPDRTTLILPSVTKTQDSHKNEKGAKREEIEQRIERVQDVDKYS